MFIVLCVTLLLGILEDKGPDLIPYIQIQPPKSGFASKSNSYVQIQFLNISIWSPTSGSNPLFIDSIPVLTFASVTLLPYLVWSQTSRSVIWHLFQSFLYMETDNISLCFLAIRCLFYPLFQTLYLPETKPHFGSLRWGVFFILYFSLCILQTCKSCTWSSLGSIWHQQIFQSFLYI
jgi:hypothetical protein